MKTLKDKFVSEHLWYLVLAYMHDTELVKDAVDFFLDQSQEITEENIEKFAER